MNTGSTEHNRGEYLFAHQTSVGMLEHSYMFELPAEESKPIIKVVGVGGGGSNAVNHMYTLGVKDVDFIICNTDRQALMTSPVPTKLQLGAHLTKGLGAGTNPEVGKEAALENTEDIRHLLGEPTQMVFITAGMGGGTGTGAAPVIAQVAREMGLLTIAVVTAPFKFEGKEKREQAMKGVDELKSFCDTVLVVLNDKLAEIHGDLPIRKAFAHADNVLANAVKSIAEIITIRGEVNVDFMDVKRVLENAGQAVMGSAEAEGKGRALQAIEQALNSPLLNDRDIRGAKRILLTMASSTEFETTMNEQHVITSFIEEKIGTEAWLFKPGVIIDEKLGASLRVTIIAAGFDLPPTDLKGFPPLDLLTNMQLELEEGLDFTIESPTDEGSIILEMGEEVRNGVPTLTSGGISMRPPTFEDLGRRAVSPVPADVLIDEEREEDLEVIQKMIDGFVQGRYVERELEIPAYVRRKIILYEMPLLPDQDIIRSRLSD